MKKGHHKSEIPLGDLEDKVEIKPSNFLTAKSKDSVIVNTNTGIPVMYVHDKHHLLKNKSTTKKGKKRSSDPFESVDSEF